MPERPIVRIRREQRLGRRIPGRKPRIPRKLTYQEQAERQAGTFSRISADLERMTTGAGVSVDPAATSPDRALVFEVIGRVDGFVHAAREAGFEWLSEDLVDPEAAGDEDDAADRAEEEASSSILYVTMPSLEGLKRLLGWWKAYADGKEPSDKLEKEWWKLFRLPRRRTRLVGERSRRSFPRRVRRAHARAGSAGARAGRIRSLVSRDRGSETSCGRRTAIGSRRAGRRRSRRGKHSRDSLSRRARLDPPPASLEKRLEGMDRWPLRPW